MICLYDINEKNFNSLGLGILRDAVSCVVTEELNGAYELEMEYPITGSHYNDIQLKRLIYAKPNMYDLPQPFRIYEITKPINGIVSISAEHISYDMSGYTIKNFEGVDLVDTLLKIKQNTILSEKNPFTIIKGADKNNIETTMKTKTPNSMRSLLAGQQGSLLDIYGGEYWFDKFDIYLMNNRGQDRGVEIRYGKNMVDVEQGVNSSKLYTGIFPFYFAKINETKTITERYFQEVYEVSGALPFVSNWLSTTEGGAALIPLIEDTPIQVKSEGLYFDNVYCFKRCRVDDQIYRLFNTYIRSGGTEGTSNWLSLTVGGGALTPDVYHNNGVYTLYKILTEGDHQNKNYIWDGSSYVEYSGDGFYYIPDPLPEPMFVRNITTSEEREDYLDLTEDPLTDNGVLYVIGQEETDPQKILTLDLSEEFSETPDIEMLKAKALDYLSKNNLQEIKSSIEVSFIKLSDSSEYERFASLEKVELGDKIKVIYEKLGVEDKLQVIATEYNVLTNKYDEIKLGTKVSTLSDTAITHNDNVSSLTNDAKYTDQLTATRLITESIKTYTIEAENASLTKAQIESLEAIKVKVPGLIEASSAEIDQLVAKLLVAENADIRNMLSAGQIEVSGDIKILSGEISIGKVGEGLYVFHVNQDGDVFASSVTITGGSITIGDNNFQVDINGNLISLGTTSLGGGTFSVDENGNAMATSFQLNKYSLESNTSVSIDEDGKLRAENAEIIGEITSENLYTKKIIFEDLISLEYKKDTQTESQDVIFTTTAVIREPALPGIYQNIDVVVNSNLPLYHARVVAVNVIFEDFHTKAKTSRGIEINLSSGSTQGTGSFMPDLNMRDTWTVYSSSPFPSSIVETRTTGQTSMLGIDSDFGPDTDGTINLGDSAFRFDDIFTYNVDNASDEKDKKDIDYDISIYDALFDSIKPVSYKFKNGQSGRTHLGFIAQDIRDSLEELGIDSKDFAGYVKSLKRRIIPKDKEEFTEDDYAYAIRYSEFHALEIRQIQYLKKYIKELEKRIKKLEEGD